MRLNLAACNVTTLNDIMHSLLARARAAWQFVLHRDGLPACATCTAHALVASDPDDARADVKLQLHHLTSVDSRDPDRYVLGPGMRLLDRRSTSSARAPAAVCM